MTILQTGGVSATVDGIIGFKHGTGETGGVSYLSGVREVFQLWHVRTRL